MTRPTYRVLAEVPTQVRPLVSEVAAALGEAPTLLEPGAGESYWLGRTSRHHVYLALDDADRRRLEHEQLRLQWAAEHAVPAPSLAGTDPDHRWLATALVPDDPQGGAAYVDAAIQAAEAIAAAPPPPGLGPAGDEATVGSPDHPARGLAGRVARVVRMVRAGVPPVAFARARRAVDALPDEVVCHGDFHTDNVLFDAAGGRVHVTDLEQMRTGPDGLDLCTLWWGLDRAEDRQRLTDHLVAGADATRRRRIAALLRWAAMTRLANAALTDPPDEALVAEARQRVGDARRTARLMERA